MEILGIDVGGSGIKAAMVDAVSGKLVSERHRIDTPKPANPALISEVIKEMVTHFGTPGPVGVSFPAVMVNGKALTHGNIDPEWVHTQVDEYFEEFVGNKFYVLNDADAAGIAEMKFGAGVGKKGMVIVITIGTGLGSGLFYDGKLIPNIELGRIFGLDGQPIEFYAADSARKREELSYEEWADRFDFFLRHIVRTFSPDHFIIGGGLSKKMEKFQEHLTVEVPIIPAENKNEAGIIGAAMFALDNHS